MNFKKSKIQTQTTKKTLPHQDNTNSKNSLGNGLSEKENSTKKTYKNLRWLTILGGLAVILGLTFLTINLVKSLDFSSLIFSFGKTLQTDEMQKTNILLVGVGGDNHDGSNLTDTLIVANIDYQNKKINLLSIPRDLYIQSGGAGGERINKVYDSAINRLSDSKLALNALKESVTNITGVNIQYAVKIDFQGFAKIVDSLGGVDVIVEKDIYDPFYPKGETIQYQTFSIKAGPHNLDGATALKYARSRKTTSDFDRSRRQQQIIAAIKEKALNLNLLTDPRKIQSLYTSLSTSFETDMAVGEIIELAKIGKEFNSKDMNSRVITDDSTSCGGFLYTPDRDLFGGAAVLLPADSTFGSIHSMVEKYFNNPPTTDTENEIQVLNGTKTPGLAQVAMDILSRNCLNVTYFGNATDRTLANTTIYYKPDLEGKKPVALEAITSLINAQVIEGIPPEYLTNEKRINTAIVIELGADYLIMKQSDPFVKLYSTTPAKPVAKPESTTTTSPRNSATTNTTTAPIEPVTPSKPLAETNGATTKTKP